MRGETIFGKEKIHNQTCITLKQLFSYISAGVQIIRVGKKLLKVPLFLGTYIWTVQTDKLTGRAHNQAESFSQKRFW